MSLMGESGFLTFLAYYAFRAFMFCLWQRHMTSYGMVQKLVTGPELASTICLLTEQAKSRIRDKKVDVISFSEGEDNGVSHEYNKRKQMHETLITSPMEIGKSICTPYTIWRERPQGVCMGKNSPDPVDAEIERLYKTYRRLAYDYIHKQLKCSVQEAQDRTSEVFERVSRSLKGQPEAETFPKPKSWLMRIAENVCSQFYIDTGEHDVFSLEHYASFNEEGESPIDIEDERASRPEIVAEQHELSTELEEYVATLSPEQQKAVLLHHRDGWTYDQISRAYSDSTPRAPSTVGQDARKGIERLRQVHWIHMEP